MSLSNNFPAIAPSLNLSFALTKSLDPRITFTRTTTATYYDGVQTAKAEENLLLQSQDFTTTWSASSSSATANTEVAPDGTTTADTLTAASGSGLSPRIAQTVSFVSGLEYVFSCFVKAGTQDYIQLLFPSGAFGSLAYANFDVTSGAGAVGTVGATATASIVDVGNGWFRCVAKSTAVTSTSSTPTLVIITSPTAARLESWNPVGTETVYLWGAQREQRSAVTAYTPTTTQPITNYIPVLQTAASGVARFDHRPLTGESLGLLVEEQRTNLVLRSEEFSNATWGKTRLSVTADSIVAPNGTLTGDQLVEDTTASNTHLMDQVSLSFTSGTSYTFSVYAKDNGRFLQLTVGTGAFSSAPYANFNLSTGVVSASGGSGTATITAVGNGWYRCTLTATASATTTASAFILLSNSGTSARFGTYTGDGYSGIYLWGAQLEAGAFPTSYIATTSASVTRNADAASMTGTNFSSWFNNAEGSVYSAFTSFRPADSATFYAYDINQDGSNYIAIRSAAGYTPDRVFPGVVVSGSAQFTGESTATTGYITMPIGNVKNAIAYKANDFANVWNGGTALTDTSGTLPTPTQLVIGTNGSSNSYLNGTIKKIAYYPSRLSDAQLAALTAS